MKTRLTVENGNTRNALQLFLRQLLTGHIVDLLLVTMETPNGSVTPALVSEPDLLVHANPLAPVMPVNAATLVGQVSVRPPRPKVAAVLRSCEARALLELVKLQQASLDDLLLISIDCAGTVSVPEYMRQVKNGTSKNMWKELYNSAKEQPGVPVENLRAACQICEQPVYDQAQVVIELFNSQVDQEILVTLPDQLAEQMGLASYGGNERAAAGEALRNARVERRDASFAAMSARLEGDEKITGVFAACIRCHNCMTVCPICYCKTCVFKSQVFDHEPMQYANWTRQKGAFRMPADTSLFHLTRLNHMVLSCVGCGMCTEACPAELPVGTVFRTIGQGLQETFQYVPGRNVEEKIPLTTFKADEWTQVGE